MFFDISADVHKEFIAVCCQLTVLLQYFQVCHDHVIWKQPKLWSAENGFFAVISPPFPFSQHTTICNEKFNDHHSLTNLTHQT